MLASLLRISSGNLFVYLPKISSGFQLLEISSGNLFVSLLKISLGNLLSYLLKTCSGFQLIYIYRRLAQAICYYNMFNADGSGIMLL